MSPPPPRACDFYVPIGGPYLVHSARTSANGVLAHDSLCSQLLLLHSCIATHCPTASLWDLLYRLHHLALPVPIQAEPHLMEAHVSEIQPKSIWMSGEGLTRSTSLADSNGSDINNISSVVRMKLALQCLPPPPTIALFSLFPIAHPHWIFCT